MSKLLHPLAISVGFWPQILQLTSLPLIKVVMYLLYRWAGVFGAEGWSYSEVLPYFIKSEHQTDPILRKSGQEYIIYQCSCIPVYHCESHTPFPYPSVTNSQFDGPFVVSDIMSFPTLRQNINQNWDDVRHQEADFLSYQTENSSVVLMNCINNDIVTMV